MYEANDLNTASNPLLEASKLQKKKQEQIKKIALVATVVLVLATMVVLVFQFLTFDRKKPVSQEPVAEEPVKQVEVDKEITHLKESIATFSATIKQLDITDPVTVYPAVDVDVYFDKK